MVTTNLLALVGVQAPTPQPAATAVHATASPAAGAAGAADSVEFSSTALSLANAADGAGSRSALIAQIRAEIGNGVYDLESVAKTERVLDGLVRDLLTPVAPRR